MSKTFDHSHRSMLDGDERRHILDPKKVLKQFPVKGKAADLGCGTGYFTIPLAVLYEVKVYAIDLQIEMLKDLRKRINNNEKVHLIRSEVTSIPLRSSSLSLVLSVNVFHEIDNIPGFVDELYRVLEDRGSAVVIDWNKRDAEIGPPITHRVEESSCIESMKRMFEHERSLDVGEYNYGHIFLKNNP